MSSQEQLSANVIEVAQQLIQGQKDPKTVALWAESFDRPDNGERYDNIDPALRQLLDDLSLAAATDESGNFLYGSSEYKQWLDEYLSSK